MASPSQQAMLKLNPLKSCHFPEVSCHIFGNDVEGGDKEEAAEGGEGHASYHGHAHAAAGTGAGSGGQGQGEAADDGGEGGHEDRTETEFGGDNHSFHGVHALIHPFFGKFYDEDGVFGGQADDHDDADLHVHAVQESCGVSAQHGCQGADNVFGEYGAEDTGRYGEEDGKWHGPAFVEGCQAEEGEDEGHDEDFHGGAGGCASGFRR